MEYRYLGKSGLYASRISLGGVVLGAEDVSQSQVDRIIGAALDSGINLVDTAYIYGSGRSEERIGKALGEKRKDVILVTKGGHYKAKYHPPSVGAPSRRYLVREVEICLKRLNTDYIDVYMWHMGDSVPPHEMLRAMDDLVRSGKVLYIGGSNTPAWKLGVASEYARNHGLNPIVLEQSGYSMPTGAASRTESHAAWSTGSVSCPTGLCRAVFLPTDTKRANRYCRTPGPGDTTGRMSSEYRPTRIGRSWSRSSRWPETSVSHFRIWHSRGSSSSQR